MGLILLSRSQHVVLLILNAYPRLFENSWFICSFSIAEDVDATKHLTKGQAIVADWVALFRFLSWHAFIIVLYIFIF